MICFAALSLPVFSLCSVGGVIFCVFFFFFPFSVELWFSIFTLLYPPSFVAPEYLCLIQCLITIRKPITFCEESSLPRVSNDCLWTDRCFIFLLGKKMHDENLNQKLKAIQRIATVRCVIWSWYYQMSHITQRHSLFPILVLLWFWKASEIVTGLERAVTSPGTILWRTCSRL